MSDRTKRRLRVEADINMVSPGQRKDKNRAAIFRLVGGPHHNKNVRLYAPWDVLEFPDGSRYEICPPYGRYKHWVYAHQNTKSEEE